MSRLKMFFIIIFVIIIISIFSLLLIKKFSWFKQFNFSLQNSFIRLDLEEDLSENNDYFLNCLNIQDSFDVSILDKSKPTNSHDNSLLDAITLYDSATVKTKIGDWVNAYKLYEQASYTQPDFFLAFSSKALASYQLGKYNEAESELRSLIKEYPMCADSRAGLAALLWKKGLIGEAQTNWAAVLGLDNRYLDKDWLLNFRHWPPAAVEDLFHFLETIR